MHIYVCVYIYTYTYTYIYVYIITRIHGEREREREIHIIIGCPVGRASTLRARGVLPHDGPLRRMPIVGLGRESCFVSYCVLFVYC